MNSSPTTTHETPQSARRGRRLIQSYLDADAVSMIQPQYFDIAVDELYADDAARMLLGFPLPSRVEVEPPSTVESAVRPPRPAPAT
jgi:hypothetical protein